VQPVLPGPRTLDFGDILSSSFTLLGRCLGDLARIVLLLSVPVAALRAIQGVYLTSLQDGWIGEETATSRDVEPGEVAIFIALFLATIVLGFVVQQIAIAGSIRLLSTTVEGQPASWDDSLRFAWERKGAVFLLSILAGVGTFLFALLCLIPGIVVGVGWSVAMPVLLIEGPRGFNALGRSWDLVKPRWWATFGLLLVVGIGTAIAAGCAGSAFSGFAAATDVVAVDFVAQFVGALLSSLITLPITVAVIVILYIDLRWRADGVWLGTTWTPPPPYPAPSHGQLPPPPYPAPGYGQQPPPPPAPPVS
jgi:hypothetical protein